VETTQATQFLPVYFSALLSLLSNIANLTLQFVNIPPEKCHIWGLGNVALLMIQSSLVGAVLGLRIYAIYNFNKIILFYLCCAGFITVLLGAWSTTETSTLVPSFAGCNYPILKQTAMRIAVAWEAQVLCDVLAFGFILVRSYLQPFKVPGSILSHIVRDGALYFAVLVLANLGNILMYCFGDPWIASSLSWFTSTISVTMMCRLMLNLHKFAEVGVLTEQTQTTSIQFASRPIHRDEETLFGEH